MQLVIKSCYQVICFVISGYGLTTFGLCVFILSNRSATETSSLYLDCVALEEGNDMFSRNVGDKLLSVSAQQLSRADNSNPNTYVTCIMIVHLQEVGCEGMDWIELAQNRDR